MERDHKKIIEQIKKWRVENPKVKTMEDASKALGYKYWQWAYSKKMVRKNTKKIISNKRVVIPKMQTVVLPQETNTNTRMILLVGSVSDISTTLKQLGF